jgi:cytochrome c
MLMKLESGLLLAGVLLAMPVLADPAELAQQKGCMACHQVAVKVLGPAYQEVAAKYKDDVEAVEMLIGKVKGGGVGTWGQIPMPANNVTDDEARQLVEWVLSQ